MKSIMHSASLAILLFCLPYVQSSDNFTTLSDAFPLLAGLNDPPSKLNPRHGGQNFTRCCLEAFSQALAVENGSVVPGEHPEFLSVNGNPVDIDNLLTSQFPCGATYQGDRKGVNQLTVPWSWCNEECPGFELSESTKLSQWISPFVGFILPSVIFCLTVPRRSKLRLPSWVFPRDIDNIKVVWAFFCAATAALIVSIDTIIWLGTVFALAGPLLLSGVYEAFIDKRIVDFMDEKIHNDKLPLSLRARILFTVLVGNLDMDSAWEPSMELANSLDHRTPQRANPSILLNPPDYAAEVVTPISTATTRAPTSAPDRQPTPEMPLPQQPEADVIAPAVHPGTAIELQSMSNATSRQSNATLEGQNYVTQEMIAREQKIFREEKLRMSILKVKIRLKSMLSCQNSFGSYVGAPVIFYIGSFIFTLLEINATLGDNDVSNALAFGEWWMSIPHTSIVSGCLLAGNNPNTLEGIAPNGAAQNRGALNDDDVNPDDYGEGTHDGGHPDTKYRLMRWFRAAGKALLDPTYEAQYLPAPMWERGRSKREWTLRLAEHYRHAAPKQMDELKKKISMTGGDWVLLSIFAFMLFFVPCVLGMLTAYFTPQVGLACRSLTFLVYTCSQGLLLMLWIWDLTWRDKSWRSRREKTPSQSSGPATGSGEEVPPGHIEAQIIPRRRTISERILDGARRPSSDIVQSTINPQIEERKTYASYVGSVTFWFCMITGLFSAIFSAIGGTLMQIIGIYRNCVCKISVGHWLDKNMSLFLSSNNGVDIKEVLHWWRPTGGVATGFLGLVCYIGWWYQRRLRFRFRKLVDKLDYRLPDSS
jgi:hypothetical protein